MTPLDAMRAVHALLGRLSPSLSARLARRQLMRPQRLAPRDWERWAVEHGERITLSGGLSALRYGADGPRVLMLHGWEGRPTQFRRLIEPLVAAGRQVIALDAPAHGQSPGREAHPVLFGEALLEAAAELGPIEAVVGHSMGAGATSYALSRGLVAERVVLLAGPSNIAGVLQRFARFLQLTERAERRFIEAVERHVGVPARELDGTIAALRFATSALIVHDRDDVFVPFADSEMLARAWLKSELLATNGLGHWRVLTDPAVCARVVDFLLGSDRMQLARAA